MAGGGGVGTRVEAAWRPGGANGRAGSVFCSLLPCQKSKGAAIFFAGDNAEGMGDPVVDRLSKPEILANLIVSKLGPAIDAWVVFPARYEGPFAVYKGFLPNMTKFGDPLGYNLEGLPAFNHLFSLLRKVQEQVNQTLRKLDSSDRRKHVAVNREVNLSKPVLFNAAAPEMGQWKPVTLFAFSKGGVVLNQLLAEVGYAGRLRHEQGETNAARREDLTYTESCVQQDRDSIDLGEGKVELRMDQSSHIEEAQGAAAKDCWVSDTVGGSLPLSVDAFIDSVEAMHFVDVGLNTRGAYLADESLVQDLVNMMKQREHKLKICLHGTPRQWKDWRRPWIGEEKDRFVALLREAIAKRGVENLTVLERLYFQSRDAINMRMHFQILEELTLP